MKYDFISTINTWDERVEECYKQGREHYAEYSKYQITIATFLLGFNILWIQIFNPTNLNSIQRAIFLILLFLLIGSVFMGMFVLRNLNEYMNEAGNQVKERVDKLSKYIDETGKTSADKLPDYLWSNQLKEGQTNFWQSEMQSILLASGFLLTIILAVILMYF